MVAAVGIEGVLVAMDVVCSIVDVKHIVLVDAVAFQ